MRAAFAAGMLYRVPRGHQHDADIGDQRNAEQQPHQTHFQTRITVEDMGEFVCNDTLQLIAIKQLYGATGYGNHRIGAAETGGKGIDAGLRQQINRRYRKPCCNRHLFHDILQTPEQGIIGRRRNTFAPQHRGDSRPATLLQLISPIQAA